MRKWIIVSIAVLCGANLAYGQQIPAKAQTCVTCHGQTGVSSSPEFPNIAGQNAAYLAIQLTAFRDGTRSNPAMAPFVSGLSDADIAALAAFYSSQARATAATGDPALVSAGENLSGACKACHGMAGVPVANEWPVLAGQQAAYLQKQLAAFRSGERVNPLMQMAVGQLGDAQFAALAAYYSQLAP